MTTDPYDSDRRIIDAAVTFLNLSGADATALRDAHETAMRDDGSGGRTYVTDGQSPVIDPATNQPARDASAWLRAMDTDRPYLVGKGKLSKPAATEPTSDYTTTGLTDLFLAVKRGDARAQAEIARRSRVGDGAPARGAPARPAQDADTLTRLMIRARAGDTAALEALTKNAR